MNNRFVSSMQDEENWKLTENSAEALKSTTNSLLDLFATIGALRTRSESDIEKAFSLAFTEDRLLATKMSFYARNIRGGLGERKTSRIIWKWLAKVYPEVIVKNLSLIPEFGRYDDLYAFIGTDVEYNVWRLICDQWNEDLINYKNGKSISLLAKWLKSVNTSSKESSKLGRLTAKKLGLSERNYRKQLSELRSYLNVVEKKMTAKEWQLINYEGVSSKAMNNYRKAFEKRDTERFAEYLTKVSEGKATIHSGTLYPYDIVEKILYHDEYNQVLEEQWKALPNYIEGENNILIMADVSGSMDGRPMATSVGLAVYFAERNRGAFYNVFMTFSANPQFVTLKGNTLHERIHNAKEADWDMNTNIEAAFHRILDVAVESEITQDEMPKSLIIISDMEFDQCTRGSSSYGHHVYADNRKTYYQRMKELYANQGYELPKVIFWNVDARQNTFHAKVEDGVQFASGQATSVFKAIISNSEFGAYDMMLQVLNDSIYDGVKI